MTMKLPKDMTDQEVFSAAYVGISKQGRPAYDRGTETCLYRGPGGTKCAIGLLIPDEVYHSSLEGNGAWSPRLVEIVGDNSALAAAIQECHDVPSKDWADTTDDEAFVKDFQKRMLRVAKDFGLCIPDLEGTR